MWNKFGSTSRRSVKRLRTPPTNVLFTKEGNHNINGKRLCNIGQPQFDGDAVNVSYFLSKLGNEIKAINLFIGEHITAVNKTIDEKLLNFKDQQLLGYQKEVNAKLNSLSTIVLANSGSFEILRKKFKISEDIDSKLAKPPAKKVPTTSERVKGPTQAKT